MLYIWALQGKIELMFFLKRNTCLASDYSDYDNLLCFDLPLYFSYYYQYYYH
jgi:hypothetical protein